MDDVELTELEKLEVTRVDGVASPANGFPVLLLKSLPAEVAAAKADADGDDDGDKCKTCGGKGTIMDGHRDCPDCDGPAGKSLPDWHAPAATLVKAIGADGKVDEQPDIDGGQQAIALIAKLIGYEAQELEAGCMGETYDIALLCEAVSALKCWLSGEVATEMAETADGTGVVMASAAKADLSTSSKNDLPDSAFAYIEPGGTKDEDGKTTPRSKRHFPVHDKAHADNAATRIAQGAEFGDKAKAKVEAAQKKFGSNSDDAGKSASVAEGEASVQTDAETDDQIAKAVQDAVTKATAPLQERLKALSDELAKVKATPIPGGPALFAAARPAAVQGEEWTAKARYYGEIADTVSDPQTAEGYRQLARQAADKAKQTT